MIEASGVNHIGIAVEQLDGQRAYYEGVLGGSWEGVETVADQRVRVAFVRMPDGVRLELLEPTDPESPIAKFLEKRGPGIHHVAYTVADIDVRLAELKAAGVRLIDEVPRDGAHGARIAFVHPKASAGVLTELCEPASVSTH